MQPSHPPLPAHTLRALADRYDAGAARSCTPVAQGLLNRSYQLDTTRGRFFLKHHLDGDPAAVARQHRATSRLGAAGLPVAPPVPDAGGHTAVLLGEDCFALHPWVEGRHRHGCELTPEQARRLGALLGQVHTRLAQVLPAPTEAARHPSADPEDSFAAIGELLVRLRKRAHRDGFDRIAEQRLLERRTLLHRCAGQRPAAGGEPPAGWVHGDFHPLNVLYPHPGSVRPTPADGPAHGPTPHAGGPVDGQPTPTYAPGMDPHDPVAIVDWDRLAVLPRAEEAVRAALIFFLRSDGVLDLCRVRTYAAAYRRAAAVCTEEMRAAVHRLWWERLNDFWMLRWRYQLHDCRADPQFPAAAALVSWWTCQYPAVRSAFCG